MNNWMCDLMCQESLNEKLERVLNERCMSEDDVLSLIKDISGIEYANLEQVQNEDLKILVNILSN